MLSQSRQRVPKYFVARDDASHEVCDACAERKEEESLLDVCEETIGEGTGSIYDTDVFQIPLSNEHAEQLASCFGPDTVDALPLKRWISSIVLPEVARLMGWPSARCTKLRANDIRAQIHRYNSDPHRDRHLFGRHIGDPIAVTRAAYTNMSAVVYLDPASFEYLPRSFLNDPDPNALKDGIL